MPAEAVMFVSIVIAMFVIFGVTLAVVSWRTNRP